MAKKYLLYIHNDKFTAEKNKSGLVNKLLNAYYENSVETKPIIIKTPADAKKAVEKIQPITYTKKSYWGA